MHYTRWCKQTIKSIVWLDAKGEDNEDGQGNEVGARDVVGQELVGSSADATATGPADGAMPGRDCEGRRARALGGPLSKSWFSSASSAAVSACASPPWLFFRGATCEGRLAS